MWGATYGGELEFDRYQVISIHAPRVGSDISIISHRRKEKQFQSTLPVWGATVKSGVDDIKTEFQSTLPVWGATIEYTS